MFKTDEVLALAQAGFTAKQIHAMSILNKSGGESTTTIKSKGELEKTLQDSLTNGDVKKIQESIDGLTNLIKAGNVAASQMPPDETMDDILASILAPDGGKINGK